jgi:hypothetical protein
MGNQRVQMERALPWLVRWARHADTRDCYLVGIVQNRFFPLRTIAQQPILGVGTGKAVVQGSLSLNMCLLWQQRRGKGFRKKDRVRETRKKRGRRKRDRV